MITLENAETTLQALGLVRSDELGDDTYTVFVDGVESIVEFFGTDEDHDFVIQATYANGRISSLVARGNGIEFEPLEDEDEDCWVDDDCWDEEDEDEDWWQDDDESFDDDDDWWGYEDDDDFDDLEDDDI